MTEMNGWKDEWVGAMTQRAQAEYTGRLIGRLALNPAHREKQPVRVTHQQLRF